MEPDIISSEIKDGDDNDGTCSGNVDKDAVYFLPLYKAALMGDWKYAETFLNDEPTSLVVKPSNLNTVLHVAVSTGRSIPFVQKLVDFINPSKSLGMANNNGDTALHYCGIAGNTKAAKILVEKDPTLNLPQLRNKRNQTPLHRAAEYGHKQTILYLLSVTRGDLHPSPFSGRDGVRLVNYLITADFYGIAYDVMRRYPVLALEEDYVGNTALLTLANKPQAFQSGNDLGFWQRLFCHCAINRDSVPPGGDVENQLEKNSETEQYGFLQHLQNKRLMHVQVIELLRLLISQILKQRESKVKELLGPPVRVAAKLGIQEFVTEIIRAYPESVLLYSTDDQMRIFQLAVLYRQEKVFNLLYQMSSQKYFVAALWAKDKNNLLHLAGKMLAPSNRISGAALQMQRELQWFKEVEKFVQPSYKEMKNKDGKTPRTVFSEEHKKLVEEGAKWMKDTASSFTLVAALVVTVVFAAAFTVPGGNDQDHGIPIFLNDTSFMIFAISNSLALFSSTTSLLMFLGILTSRYAEDDFVKALPMRLSIGLITLFFSIASMLAAFSSSLYIVLWHRVRWIAAPMGLLACVPVTLFALLQFPLMLDIVSSTFGPSIFRKQNDEIIM